MPTVWMRESPKSQTRFHRVKDCRQLLKRPSRGEQRPLIEVDIAEVYVRPCKTCYPDVPRIKVRHPYCHTCDSKHPCEHNGGVLIRRRGHGEPQYVWPDSNLMPYYRATA